MVTQVTEGTQLSEVVKASRRFANSVPSRRLNDVMAGLYSIAFGASPILKYSVWSSYNKKCRYHATKYYNIKTREDAARHYIQLANALCGVQN
jgi:hypothetical protein